MELFISGLLKEDTLQQGYGAANGATISWLTPDDFVARRKLFEKSESDQCWIWLYHAPWALLTPPATTATDLQQLMSTWLKQQRLVLQLQHEKPISLRLVNCETTTAEALFTSLGLKPSATNSLRPRSQPGISEALGKLLEWIAPQFWDVFEALEAVAWIPQGTPFFRNHLTPPPLEALQQIIALIGAGHKLPEVEEELAKQNYAVDELNNTLKNLEDSDDELEELKQENELLLLQLHQVQEELENYFLVGQKMGATFSQSQQLMDKARVLLCRLAP